VIEVRGRWTIQSWVENTSLQPSLQHPLRTFCFTYLLIYLLTIPVVSLVILMTIGFSTISHIILIISSTNYFPLSPQLLKTTILEHTNTIGCSHNALRVSLTLIIFIKLFIRTLLTFCHLILLRCGLSTFYLINEYIYICNTYVCIVSAVLVSSCVQTNRQTERQSKLTDRPLRCRQRQAVVL